MSVITSPQRQAAEVEREPTANHTALEAPMIRLSMTYSGKSAAADVSPELMSWLDARCEDTGASALDVLIACAEMCADIE